MTSTPDNGTQDDGYGQARDESRFPEPDNSPSPSDTGYLDEGEDRFGAPHDEDSTAAVDSAEADRETNAGR